MWSSSRSYPWFSNISSISRHLTAILLFFSWSAGLVTTGIFGRTLGNSSLLPVASAPIIFHRKSKLYKIHFYPKPGRLCGYDNGYLATASDQSPDLASSVILLIISTMYSQCTVQHCTPHCCCPIVHCGGGYDMMYNCNTDFKQITPGNLNWFRCLLMPWLMI